MTPMVPDIHLEFRVEYPATMSQKELFEIWAREADAALGAKEAKVVVDLWKCVGARRVIATPCAGSRRSAPASPPPGSRPGLRRRESDQGTCCYGRHGPHSSRTGVPTHSQGLAADAFASKAAMASTFCMDRPMSSRALMRQCLRKGSMSKLIVPPSGPLIS